jgi:hypothetical protein
MQVLIAIAAGHADAITDITACLAFERATVNQSIRVLGDRGVLGERGVIARAVDPDDRRRTRLSITAGTRGVGAYVRGPARRLNTRTQRGRPPRIRLGLDDGKLTNWEVAKPIIVHRGRMIRSLRGQEAQSMRRLVRVDRTLLLSASPCRNSIWCRRRGRPRRCRVAANESASAPRCERGRPR